MGFVELIILALGLSADAFAVSLTAGLTMKKVTLKKALIVGAYFGLFQAGMPVIGYLLGGQFAGHVSAFTPWIAFTLLSFLGGKMLLEVRKKKLNTENRQTESAEASLAFKKMLPLAVATSIDALAVGVSFALLHVNIIPAISKIGIITLIASMIGVKIGNLFGRKFESKAGILGGVILIGMGVYILLEYFLTSQTAN